MVQCSVVHLVYVHAALTHYFRSFFLHLNTCTVAVAIRVASSTFLFTLTFITTEGASARGSEVPETIWAPQRRATM